MDYGRRQRFGSGPSFQDWSDGATVKVGWLTLRVIERVPTPGDGLPDFYRLVSEDGTRRYEFTPHDGLYRVYS
jgi:hypothetical protein